MQKAKSLTSDPIVELAQYVQKKFKKSIKTAVVDFTGSDHRPWIEVEIIIPIPTHQLFLSYIGKGLNQKIAKQDAAKAALKELVRVYGG